MEKMNIESSYHNGYRVLAIKDHLGIYTNIDDLVSTVEQVVNKNETNIALSFTDESFLYSDSIRAILQCFELINEKEGNLAILEPNDHILSTFNVLELDGVIKIFQTREALMSA